MMSKRLGAVSFFNGKENAICSRDAWSVRRSEEGWAHQGSGYGQRGLVAQAVERSRRDEWFAGEACLVCCINPSNSGMSVQQEGAGAGCDHWLLPRCPWSSLHHRHQNHQLAEATQGGRLDRVRESRGRLTSLVLPAPQVCAPCRTSCLASLNPSDSRYLRTYFVGR